MYQSNRTSEYVRKMAGYGCANLKGHILVRAAPCGCPPEGEHMGLRLHTRKLMLSRC